MRNLVYILSQTKTVETLRQIITVALIADSWFSGLIRFGVTPGGGGAAGVLSRLDTDSGPAIPAIVLDLGIQIPPIESFDSDTILKL